MESTISDASLEMCVSASAGNCSSASTASSHSALSQDHRDASKKAVTKRAMRTSMKKALVRKAMQKILVKKAARRLLARARQQEGRLEGATSEPHQRAIMACLERLAACPPTPCLEGISEEILPDAPARQDCVEICAMTEFVPPCAPLPQSPEPSSTDVSLVHRMAGVGMRFQQMARPIVSPIYPACYGHPPQPPSECDSKSARSTEQANASRENAPLNIFSAERFSSSASSPPPTPAEWQLYGWTQRPYQK